MITSRRSFITGLGAALVTAPAIVRAGSLMPVKQMPTAETLEALLRQRMDAMYEIMREGMANCLYGDSFVYAEGSTIHIIPLAKEELYQMQEKSAEITFDRR